VAKAKERNVLISAVASATAATAAATPTGALEAAAATTDAVATG